MDNFLKFKYDSYIIIIIILKSILKLRRPFKVLFYVWYFVISSDHLGFFFYQQQLMLEEEGNEETLQAIQSPWSTPPSSRNTSDYETEDEKIRDIK